MDCGTCITSNKSSTCVSSSSVVLEINKNNSTDNTTPQKIHWILIDAAIISTVDLAIHNTASRAISQISKSSNMASTWIAATAHSSLHITDHPRTTPHDLYHPPYHVIVTMLASCVSTKKFPFIWTWRKICKFEIQLIEFDRRKAGGHTIKRAIITLQNVRESRIPYTIFIFLIQSQPLIPGMYVSL